MFAYTIRITNNGNVTAQLVSRHWIITDADNQVQEVNGLGVVGEQPVLKPGDTFEYSSGATIPTPVGTMRGSYQMVAEDGTRSRRRSPRSRCPCRARCIERSASSRVARSSSRRRAGLRRAAIVHQTMPTNTSSANAASR